MIYVNWLIWYMVYTNALLSSPAHIQAAPDLVSTPNNNLDTPFSFAAARWQLPAMEYLMWVGKEHEHIVGEETCACCNKEGLTSLHAAAGFVMPKKDRAWYESDARRRVMRRMGYCCSHYTRVYYGS